MKTLISITKRWQGWLALGAVGLAVGLLGYGVSSFAAKGGIPGPPTGGESPNNLSYPGLHTGTIVPIEAFWSVPADGDATGLGVYYSYGCDKPEGNPPYSYPNTSCVDNLDDPTQYYTAAQCTDGVPPSPCVGLPVSRIYWQKVDENRWWADDHSAAAVPVEAEYTNWGDALEAVSWNEKSVIRVETQPFSSTIPGFDPTIGPCLDDVNTDEDECKTGFQMWHVSGQGITEHWGVRATAPDEGSAIPYVYETPFQIIKETGVNDMDAMLNIAKMAEGSAVCHAPGGNEGDPAPVVPAETWTVDPVTGKGEWSTMCTYHDEPYSIETSVGGKYVYGYNWRMKDVDLGPICGDQWLKTGYWRLTFYAPNVSFVNTPDDNDVAPPDVASTPVDIPAPLAALAEEEEDPEEDDRLYRPVFDRVNNLTYIDICIVAKNTGSGGGKGGGKGGGSGGKGGGNK